MKANDYEIHETAWCPGCGNFAILAAIKAALQELGKKPHEVLLVGGIGQAAKLPQYLSANGLCTLHGRALPAAMGARLANSRLTVLVHSGDGDCYGEGGNHLIHAIRRDVDLTLIIHNNQTYGLTQGQASPTSDPGFVTKLQPRGVISGPLRGPALAIALGCRFVARAFSGDGEHLAKMIREGVEHKGLSFIEVLQPCISMNKRNTHAWYKERVHDVTSDPGYDAGDRVAAFSATMEWDDRIPVGVLFEGEGTPFEDRIPQLQKGPLVKQAGRDMGLVRSLIGEFM